MAKEYIRDADIVRLCSSNVAKMNIFESIYYHRYRMYDNITEHINMLKDIEYWAIIINTFCLLILPIAYPIMAYFAIRAARKEMKEYEERKKKCTQDQCC